MNEGLVRTRPVYSQYVLYPAIFCFILANILGGFRTFTTAVLVLFLIPFGGLKAQEEEKKPLSPETVEFMLKFKEGEISTVNRLKLAELLAKDERPEKSLEVYGEILRPGNYSKYQIASMNMGTVNLMGGKIQEGIKVYKNFNNLVGVSDEQRAVMRQNILLALRQQKQQQQKKDQQKKNEKKQGSSGDQQKDNESKGGKGEQQKSQDKENQDQKKDKEKNKQKDSDQKKKEEQERQQKKQLTKQPQTLDEKEEELRKKRKMVKIPAMLKQIMDTDRQLQKKYQDTSTRDMTKSRVRKDW